MKNTTTQVSILVLLVLSICVITIGCGGHDGESDTTTLIVYSGRNERLIGPLLDRFREQTGIEVQVRYGGTSELAATLMEEGRNSPAGVFISQDAGALGALSRAGLLEPLAPEILDRLEPRFRSSHGDWVGLSGRARVVVYNTDRIQPDELPQTLEEATDERFRGRFGVAPTNASFQAHMAVYGAVNGGAALAKLLDGIAANEPLRYPKNSRIVEAVINGEIDWGLVNHYYLWRALAEDPAAAAENFFMPGGGVSHFLNLAGAGMPQASPAAQQLIEFMLGENAQRYFAEETFEYPLVEGVALPPGLPALAELPPQQLDYQQVAAALDEALAAIHKSGLLEFR